MFVIFLSSVILNRLSKACLQVVVYCGASAATTAFRPHAFSFQSPGNSSVEVCLTRLHLPLNIMWAVTVYFRLCCSSLFIVHMIYWFDIATVRLNNKQFQKRNCLQQNSLFSLSHESAGRLRFSCPRLGDCFSCMSVWLNSRLQVDSRSILYVSRPP